MRDAKDLSPLPEQLSQGSPDDITEEPPTETSTVKPHKSGRFKRTALTFFGVRKSICILPSFFGGRSKSQSKWPSKKGLTKSRTHDGLSHDDNLRGVYSSAGDFEYCSHRDSAVELHASCRSECSHSDQKSLTVTRQKKGLRGLFSSFKYHRNHRNVELDKAEMIAMTSPICTQEVPVVQHNTNLFVTECLGSEPDVPIFADDKCDLPLGLECSDSEVMPVEKHVEQESPKSRLDDQLVGDQMEEVSFTVVSRELEEIPRDHSEPCLTMSEPILKLPTPAGSSEQLNLIFGEVASLKSFDSLTGCGDIIADQEDDSITESTVSGERSRSGGKRASCFLTYQGGGEDMASPEDLDEECLQDFWRSNASEEICSTCNQEHTDLTADLTTSHNIDLLNSQSEQQASGVDTSIADVLTPQSEHQESVPNSDEGYYDSTTPGPEEGQEKAERQRADRMPRDSYSGDALYELFAPDESLLSPHYESKSKLPALNQCDYLGDASDGVDSAFVPDINRLHLSAEVYKVDSFHERPSPCSEPPEIVAQNTVGWLEVGASKNCKSNPKAQTSANKSSTSPDMVDNNENIAAPVEKRKKAINAESDKRHSTISFGSTSNPDFEAFCEPKEQHLEENKPVALPYRNKSAQSPVCATELDDGQTVSFSQALVDYTKHSQMLSNLPSNSEDLERTSAFTPHMQVLPTIVTFDVVDMHNEGEYDEQIHIELEEDISSPYQEFEESYLQKDAFAEFDYQMLDLYDQNLISNTWAVASLPRHLGLTRVSQSMSHPLSLDRRSRSLDTESLELKMPDAYRAAFVPCSHAEKMVEKGFSPFYKKNVPVSASEVRDSGSIMALSWQTRSEMALSRSSADGEIHDTPSQTPAKQKLISSPPGSGLPNGKQHLSSNASGRIACDFMPQNSELHAVQRHSCLQSDCGPSHSSGVYSGMMEEASGDADKFAITQLLQ